MTQALIQVTVTAVGEVRDADGNLLNQGLELAGTVTMTAEEAAAFIEAAQLTPIEGNPS